MSNLISKTGSFGISAMVMLDKESETRTDRGHDQDHHRCRHRRSGARCTLLRWDLQLTTAQNKAQAIILRTPTPLRA